MDPVSLTCSAITLTTFALSASIQLTTALRGLQGHDKRTIALKRELIDLAAVLESLQQTIESNPAIDFDALKSPLHRCGTACKEYGELVARFSKHSGGSKLGNIADWAKQKYLQGDVTDFKDMLAGYKATINIAIANVNIRVAAITPQVLEEYKAMMCDTTQELQQHLREMDERIQVLSNEAAQHGGQDNAEWKAIMEEKMCTQQGLAICAQLSAQIEQLEPTIGAGQSSFHHPKARGFIRSGLSATKASIQTMMDELHSHKNVIERQIQEKASTQPMSEEVAEELRRLQATKDSIHQCIRVVSDADNDTAEIERHNVFEDITLADRSYNFTVSTVGDLVTARRINLTGGSYNIAGQIADESFQKAVEAFAMGGIQPSASNRTPSPPNPDVRKGEQKMEFHSRHGPGMSLLGVRQSTPGRE
ncbi:hypothetical protein NLG97_g2847 [Lecanicillium saksenae]|uniref:Uncharacterized protein n=1 Tax=Lecanicillium saksenae TaxID=468837 RepID=A0ACC1R2D7_9HYPO|nr:hypothetical protein NLG97_g2847 [Lecanicillium saksenae]